MYKIAIAGAGAMGGRIGSQIKEANYDVTLIDNWSEHIDSINKQGLKIQRENNTYYLPMKAVYPSQSNTQYDLIIILTKAMQSREMIKSLYDANAIKDTTAIVSLMNGIGHDEMLSEFFPKEQIFLAVTMWTANLLGPGQLLLEGEGAIELQRADGESDFKTEEINKVFNKANLNSTISDNVFKSIWTKATVNSVLNPLCSILNKKIGELAEYNQTRNMIMPIIKEIVEVGKAKQISLSFDRLLQKVESTFPESEQGLHYPSMHQDLYNGRLTEIDYLNGKISNYGDELNIETPNNKLLTHLIHQLEMNN
ncbi:2-dehydropantoate 2-reductase [Staphylococcus nepalensis]|uniref:2-dehydropantoate 2-reductase n=1 Tax=Staphylococcus nepalensis TaxID=214473 RepID=UPI0031BA2E6F